MRGEHAVQSTPASVAQARPLLMPSQSPATGHSNPDDCAVRNNEQNRTAGRKSKHVFAEINEGVPRWAMPSFLVRRVSGRGARVVVDVREDDVDFWSSALKLVLLGGGGCDEWPISQWSAEEMI